MNKLSLYLLLALSLILSTCDSDIVEPPDGPDPDLPTRFYPPDQIFGFDLHALGIGEIDLDSIPGDTLYYIDPSSSKVRGTLELDLKKRGSDISDPDFILSPVKLTDLDGLQFFINLEEMALASNNITNLPLDSLKRFKSLTMSFNRVKDLVVTGNPLLENLQYTSSASANPNTERVAEIDLTQNPALKTLRLPSHQIITIDVSQNVALEDIDLTGNPGPDGDPNTGDIEIDSFIYDQIEPAKRLGVVREGTNPPPPGGDRFYPPDQIFGFDLHALGIGEMDLDSIPGDTLYYIEPESGKVNAVTSLDLKKRGSDIDDPDFILSPEKLTDLDGLQFFTNLEDMSLTSNNITNIPLGGNAKLNDLSMSFNRVKELDVSSNPLLERILYTGSGQANPATEKIAEIDLTSNAALRVLSLPSHQIVNIDVSQNTALEEIDLTNNPGPDGDPNTPDIEIDSFIYDQIDPSKRLGVIREGSGEDPPMGDRFYLPDTVFGFDLFALGIGAADTDSIPGMTLYYIEPESDQVKNTTVLDLKKRGSDIDDPDFILSPEKLTNLDGLQFFSGLEDISLTSNDITNLPLNGSPGLVSLSMTFNRVGNLDVMANTALEVLNYGGSGNADPATEKIMTIDLGQNAALRELTLKDHEIVNIDVSSNTALEAIDLTGNPGPDGDPETPDIEIDSFIYDQILPENRLGVSRQSADNPPPPNRYIPADTIFGYDLFQLGLAQREVDMMGNNTYFIITDDPNITSRVILDLRKNSSRPDSLDILSPEKLLDLDGIQFFTSLQTLLLTSNLIESMEITANTELVDLQMNNNRLGGELDLSLNTKLEIFSYNASSQSDDNQKFSTIDVSNSPDLRILELRRHNLETLDLSNNPVIEELDLRDNPGPDGNGVVIPAAIYDDIINRGGTIQGAVRGE